MLEIINRINHISLQGTNNMDRNIKRATYKKLKRKHKQVNFKPNSKNSYSIKWQPRFIFAHMCIYMDKS